MVKMRGGEIIIDGYNINEIGLDALRSSIALVPQDTTLFLGTLRENLSVTLLYNHRKTLTIHLEIPKAPEQMPN
jgi:ABC-type multidrug transport system fused ATPase/permease subunit